MIVLSFGNVTEGPREFAEKLSSKICDYKRQLEMIRVFLLQEAQGEGIILLRIGLIVRQEM